MSDVSQFNQASLAVAVAMDEHAESLVILAGRLAKKLGKKLVLMHAVEPWLELPPAMFDGVPLTGLGSAAEQELHQYAEQRLLELSGVVPAGVAVERVIVHGKAKVVVPAAAAAAQLSFLIVGAKQQSLQHTLGRGLSTALGMVSSAPLPVLIVDPTQPWSIDRPGFRCLVADDLSDTAQAALEFALEMASAFGNAELRHVYVNSIDREQLATALRAAAATAHAPLDQEVSADLIFSQVEMQLLQRLQSRAAVHIDYLENGGGNYEAAVLSGDVQHELAHEIERLQPDLVVFGQHHVVYKAPMFWGRMPYRSMVRHGLPILVVPGAGEA